GAGQGADQAAPRSGSRDPRRLRMLAGLADERRAGRRREPDLHEPPDVGGAARERDDLVRAGPAQHVAVAPCLAFDQHFDRPADIASIDLSLDRALKLDDALEAL